MAFSVAWLTVALTPSSLSSLFSTRIAQEAHVIPVISNSMLVRGLMTLVLDMAPFLIADV